MSLNVQRLTHSQPMLKDILPLHISKKAICMHFALTASKQLISYNNSCFPNNFC